MPLNPIVIHFPRNTFLHTKTGTTTHPTVIVQPTRAAESIGHGPQVLIDAGDQDGRHPMLHISLDKVAYFQLLEALTAAGEVFR